MFANLLAAAMDEATSPSAHPAFVEILKQLTPDEARILALLNRHQQLPIATVTAIPGGDPSRTIVLLRNFSLIGWDAGCKHLQLVPSYLDNICRLGLAEVLHSPLAGYDWAYVTIEQRPEVWQSGVNASRQWGVGHQVHRHRISVTDFGEEFCATCVVTPRTIQMWTERRDA